EADWALHEVPIVFVTALITQEEARDGRRINGHRVVPKPTRGFDLIRVVEENLPCCSGVWRSRGILTRAGGSASASVPRLRSSMPVSYAEARNIVFLKSAVPGGSLLIEKKG